MDEKKPCVRCDRAIDPYARICPYCNQDQTAPVVAETSSAPAYVPPAERNWRRHALMAAGGIVLLIASFAIGAVINREDTPENAPEAITDTIGQEEKQVPRARRSDLTLVPVTDPSTLDQPITSAPIPNPAQGVPTEYQRSDATAVSSVEYAALAQRAEAERKAQQQLVDPRSITGPAYAQGRPAPRQIPQQTAQNTAPVPPPMTSAAPELEPRESQPASQASNTPDRQSAPRETTRVSRVTRPVPEYQPLPQITVSQNTTARLELTVGPDGRVKQVNIKSGVPGQTPQLIAAVQRWRFKPATENGEPVTGRFSVDISFNAND